MDLTYAELTEVSQFYSSIIIDMYGKPMRLIENVMVSANPLPCAYQCHMWSQRRACSPLRRAPSWGSGSPWNACWPPSAEHVLEPASSIWAEAGAAPPGAPGPSAAPWGRGSAGGATAPPPGHAWLRRSLQGAEWIPDRRKCMEKIWMTYALMLHTI